MAAGRPKRKVEDMRTTLILKYLHSTEQNRARYSEILKYVNTIYPEYFESKNQGAIFPDLKFLQREGLIVKESRERNSCYILQEVGKAYINQIYQEMNSLEQIQ